MNLVYYQISKINPMKLEQAEYDFLVSHVFAKSFYLLYNIYLWKIS